MGAGWRGWRQDDQDDNQDDDQDDNHLEGVEALLRDAEVGRLAQMSVRGGEIVLSYGVKIGGAHVIHL